MYAGGDPWDRIWSRRNRVERAPPVPTDTVLAHMWFNMAGANGEARARTQRERLERYMTREDIKRATDYARRCVESGYRECGSGQHADSPAPSR
ncbi:MAG: hypothetical protein OXI46_08470 [Gemmatimonadota bacterium]|nr:hypothetical protein [Gemmatimonadota bacterium]